jgi:MFS family permease
VVIILFGIFLKAANMNEETLWTKDFVTVSVINFLIILVYYLLMVTIASYATYKFHASISMAGLVAGIFIIGALIGRLATGHIIEDIGNKRILILGVIFFIIASTLYFGAINLELLLINRLLHGIALGVTGTATGTIIAKIIPHNRRGEGIGYYSMSAILAAAIGPFLGILLIQHANYEMIFVFSLILGVIAFAVALFVNEPINQSSEQDQIKTVKSFKISNFLEPEAIPISIVTLIISFSFSGVLTFMSFYAQQLHLAEAASFFFLVYAIAIFISRPFSGRLFDIKGANIVAYPCLFIYAVGMLLYSQANDGITLLLAGSIMGLGYGNFLSCAQAISIKAIPRHRLGLATSTYFIFWELGFGVGPYLLGFLVPFSGYRGLYLVMVVMIIASTLLYYFLHGRKTSLA